MNNMNDLDSESYQIREVYALFGLAMYFVQCLERTIGISMVTVYGPGTQKITREQFDISLESYFKKTLGNLIHEFRKSSTIADDFESTLKEALTKRNWLAHNYFWERAEKFKTENGREDMKEELQKIANYFEEIDHNFTLIIIDWGEKHGITEEMIQIKFDELY